MGKLRKREGAFKENYLYHESVYPNYTKKIFRKSEIWWETIISGSMSMKRLMQMADISLILLWVF
jgi:hypothetical protein